MGMPEEAKKVLVICTGNSCRSILAEALINTLGQGRFVASSAGSQPAGYVHPNALEVLQRHSIDPGNPESQSWDEFADVAFDLLITVCDFCSGRALPGLPRIGRAPALEHAGSCQCQRQRGRHRSGL